MAAVLNSNVASLYASKNLQGAQSKMADSVERLSSGLRINRAKDDAAGLGISNALTSQINSANQGVRNLNDGISLVQTAEGAITAAQEMAQRILTLAVQGANGTLGLNERTAIQSEMNTLLSAMDLISTRTTFSGLSLLDSTVGVGSGTAKFTLQVGKDSTDKIELDQTAFKMVGKTTGQATAVNALIIHADITSTVMATAQTQFRSVATSAGTLIENLSKQRSLLGAYQNQIEYTVSNVTDLAANLSAARSNVQDTDYASETASLTKGQILQQAATAMLAQANQMPNVILSLLK
jgi:flagellin